MHIYYIYLYKDDCHTTIEQSQVTCNFKIMTLLVSIGSSRNNGPMKMGLVNKAWLRFFM